MKFSAFQKANLRSKRFIKHKLLLDEGLPPAKSYPKLNRTHDIKHITHDFGLSGISDQNIYLKACKESRLLVVFNTKHFKPLTQKNYSSLVTLSTNMSTKQADAKLTSVIKRLTSDQLVGHVISISQDGVVITKV